MRYSNLQVVFQEVPGEISLALSISGCPIHCKGCHSQQTWNPGYGEVLDIEAVLAKYGSLITCVLFYGGEWNSIDLIPMLETIRSKGLKTCLYTGANKPIKKLLPYLDFIKVGRWIEQYGGLTSPTTNQVFYKVDADGNLIDHTFIFKEV